MSSAITSYWVQAMLAALREIGEREDDRYRGRVREREAQFGVPLGASDCMRFADDAPQLPVRGRRPQTALSRDS